MTDTKTEFKPGDVVRYDTAQNHHCREGMAIARQRPDGSVVLLDTYWRSSGDEYVLSEADLATVKQVFNLADYDELAERGSAEKSASYNPADRQTITSQHGLVVRRFIRKGAQPDLETQIENAQRLVDIAERTVESAKFTLECARRDLAELEAKRQ